MTLPAPLVSVSVRRHDLALRRPLVTAQETLHVRTVFLLSVCDADGVCGVGEAAPLVWAGTETVAQCEAALTALKGALLRGGDVDGLLAGCPAAAAALDLARHDLAACRLGVPLVTLLADGEGTTSVAVNALVADAESARTAVEAGFETLKLKVGTDVPADARRLAAVRAAVGPHVALRIDPNGAWADAEHALHALRALSSVGLEYCEQPVPAGPDAVAAMARVRAEGDVPIAPDESVMDLCSARALLDGDAADLLVLKPMRLGGLDRAMEVASLARERGVDVVVTGFLGSVVERTAALHLAAALDGLVSADQRRAHGLGAGSWLADDVAAVEVIQGGRLTVPTRAGHGVVLPGSR